MSETLNREGYVIPSLWRVISPAFLFIVMFTAYHALFSIDDLMAKNKYLDEMTYIYIFFGFFMSIIISFAIMNGRASYLSLPGKVRKESLVICLLIKKIKLYCISWVVFNFILALLLKMAVSGAAFVIIGVEISSLVAFVLVFNADISRYQFSALQGVIDTWKDKNSQG